MNKYPFTDYGKEVKKRLIEMDKDQSWLIDEVSKKTGKFCDCSLMNKILTGRVNSEPIIFAINNLVGLK